MSGSVRRLTLLVVVSILPNYSVLQRAETFVQQPFRLRTNFLRDFMKIRNELFPFSFTTTAPPISTTTKSHLEQLFIQNESYSNSESRNSVVVKRRVPPQALLENPKIRNFIRRRMQYKLKISGQKAFRRSRTSTDSVGVNVTKGVSNNTSGSPLQDDTYLASTLQPLDYVESTSEFENIEDVTTFSPPDNSSEISPLTTDLDITTTERPFDISLQELTSSSPTSTTEKPAENEGSGNFFGYFFSTLTRLPIIGNMLRASVDPLYRPIIEQIRPNVQNGDMKSSRKKYILEDWCFGILGCLEPTVDFFHPFFRPVNFPPNSRDYIDVQFTVHSREDPQGLTVFAHTIEDFYNSSFSPSQPTKLIIHGYLHDRHETWMWEMVRGLLIHADYNVITVDWSSGSHALYSQATANTRVVALETIRLLKWLHNEYSIEFKDVHIIGHSLGAHTAGYVGASVKGVGRITGLDPAEPYFQYMPASVRLDPSDANFVDVIHTDIDSFFAITGLRGYGLQQPVGHIDFYPNGGHNQPGCNQLLTRIPYTLTEGADIVEGINAAQTELVSCDHIRASKLFTDSLLSSCSYLAFVCSSYNDYNEGKCFSCGAEGNDCASMGVNANRWSPENRTNVKMFLDTHHAPNFCLYHYLLKIKFDDPVFSRGTLRGRLEVTIITEEGELRKFDLTSLSPIKFPRRGSKTFLLVHNEDLTGSQEALLSWTFESDLMDPFTFCVLFCRADLGISSVTLISVDSPASEKNALRLRDNFVRRKGGSPSSVWREVIMCHKKGDRVALIRNEETIKISSSPLCSLVNKSPQLNDQIDSETPKLQRVSLLH